MDWKLPVLAVAVLFLLHFPQSLLAQERQNDQTFVVGAGLGGHEFATPHHAGSEDSTEVVVKSALMSQIYGEWYVLDTLGIGLRYITFGASASASTTVTVGDTTESATSDVDVSVDNYLATVNWVPLGAQSYARLGVLGGLGMSFYEYKETNDPGGSNSDSTSGPVALAGIYVDWGADGFGARFGAQYMASQLGKINGSTVDVSGRDIYFDLRWAF